MLLHKILPLFPKQFIQEFFLKQYFTNSSKKIATENLPEVFFFKKFIKSFLNIPVDIPLGILPTIFLEIIIKISSKLSSRFLKKCYLGFLSFSWDSFSSWKSSSNSSGDQKWFTLLKAVSRDQKFRHGLQESILWIDYGYL